jgi:hypothetical protein
MACNGVILETNAVHVNTEGETMIKTLGKKVIGKEGYPT